MESLDIPKGKIIGIWGPNGSGKTTLLKILAFLYEINSGELIFNGNKIKKENMQKARQSVTMLMEEPYLLHRNVRDNIKYAIKLSKTYKNKNNYSFYLSMLGLNNENYLFKNYNELSHGERTRVAMLMHLILDRDVLILDEPTNNIDVKSKKYCEITLKNLKNSGKTIIISSHDIFFILKHADIIHSIYKGKLYNNILLNIIDYNFEIGKNKNNFCQEEHKEISNEKVVSSTNEIFINGNNTKYYLDKNGKGLIKASIISTGLYNDRYVITVDINDNICYMYYNNVISCTNTLCPGNTIYLCLKDNVLNI
jgi:ABC-type multidrug transport system ATPase subunit